MTSYNNDAPVYNQAGVQNIHGNVFFSQSDISSKRSRFDRDGLDNEKQLDDDILASLAFPHMFDRRANVESAHRQTCQWLFDLDEYRAWKSKPRGLLWIKGKPGSGKSTLMSHLYRKNWYERQVGSGINLEFFFSARGSPLQRSPAGMLRSLLNQIFYHDSDNRQPLRAAYQEKRGSFGSSDHQWEWQLHELKSFFIDAVAACASRRQVTLLIDALDEAGKEAAADTASYFHSVNERIGWSMGTARICISCRHYPVLSNIRVSEIHVERHNHHDIASYVRDHLDMGNMPNGTSQQDQADMILTLVDTAHGIFQWVRLVTPMVVQWMGDGDTKDQIRVNLSLVPKDLEAVYEHILVNIIEPRHRQKSLRLFRWVSLAQRPLSILELRYALSAEDIKLGSAAVRYQDVSDFKVSAENMIRRIKTWSGGLIEIASNASDSKNESPDDELSVTESYMPYEGQKVQVMHQSVKDFLISRGLALLTMLSDDKTGVRAVSKPLLDSATTVKMSHAVLYSSCLKYLCVETSDRIVEDRVLEPSGLDEREPKTQPLFPFLEYTAFHFLYHAERSGTFRSEDLEDETQRLNKSIAMLKFAVNAFGHFSRYNNPELRGSITILHLAARANLTDLIEYRIQCNDDVNAQNERGWVPMHIAARTGHLEMVKLLHEAKADLHVETEKGDTPLLLAAAGGHTDIFNFLLAAGVSFETRNTRFETALYAAASEGRAAICELCINAGADVNVQGGEYGYALQAAAAMEGARTSNERVIRLLLDAGADVNAQGGEYGSAIQAAAFSGDTRTVKLLLAAGADVNVRGGYYGCCLQAAAAGGERGNEKMRSLLLEAGAESNTHAGYYGIILQDTAQRNNERVVSLLLDAGADISVQGGYYGNVLQAAALWGNKKVLDLLLEAGVDVNVQGGEYGTALQAAAAVEGNGGTVSLLLQAGADVNVRGGEYGSVLQAAAVSGDARVLGLLLEAGADVNAQEGRYGNALQAAVSRGNGDAVSLLLEAGAHVNAQGGIFGNALMAAIFEGSTLVMSLLLEAGVDFNVQGQRLDDLVLNARAFGNEAAEHMILAASAKLDEREGQPNDYGRNTSSPFTFDTDGDGDIEPTTTPSDTGSAGAVIHRTPTTISDPADDTRDSGVVEGQWLLQMLSRFFPWT